MVMQEQSKRLSQPLRWTRAGRVAVIVTLLVLIGGGVATVVATTTAKKLAPGCIEVTFASTLGAAAVHPCGARAREMCASPAQNPGLAEHGVLREACVRGGLPYGSKSASPSG
ncbi:MAG TPA: hypothetical protein VGI26_06330 [Solirubrobacteraceae bacterium]|jgi:hypothetical protein